MTREDWLALYDLAEEQGKQVRLDWKGEEPPSNMQDVRAAAALLQVNDIRENRKIAFGTCGFARGLGRRLERTAELTKDERLASKTEVFWCLACDIALELVWMPTWADLADGPFTEQGDRKLVLTAAETSASTDRSLHVSPCPLGAGTGQERLSACSSVGNKLAGRSVISDSIRSTGRGGGKIRSTLDVSTISALVIDKHGSTPQSSTRERPYLSLSTDAPDLASTPTKSIGWQGGTSFREETARAHTAEAPVLTPSCAPVLLNE